MRRSCLRRNGDFEKAMKVIVEARQRALRSPRSHFSCWTYEHLTRKDFLDELEEMNEQFAHQRVKAPLLERSG
jgi:hypothetical protein